MPESDYERQRAYIREIQQKAAEAIRSIDPNAKVHETGSFMCFGNYMPPNKSEAVGFSLVENVKDRTKLVLKPDFRKKATVEDLQAMQQELLAQGVGVTVEGGIIDTHATTPFSRIYGNRSTETASSPSAIPERERKESGPVPTERPEKPKAEGVEVEAENNVLRLYLFGEMSDNDKEKFEATVDVDPVLQTELQKLQGKLESDWYGKKLTGEQQKRLWELYVIPHRSELKNKHARYLRDFLIQVQMSGDARIMPNFNELPSSTQSSTKPKSNSEPRLATEHLDREENKNMSEEDKKEPNAAEMESPWVGRITIIPEDPGRKKAMVQFEYTNPRELFAFQEAAERILADTCRAFNQIPPESPTHDITAWELWYMPPGETPETMMQKVKEEMPNTFALYDERYK